MRWRLGATLLALLVCAAVRGQLGEPQNDGIGQILESLSEEGYDVEDNEEVQNLMALYRSPLNINTASRETLEQLFFLTDIQIENLLYYLYVNGPMLTVYELQAVEGFNDESIRRLLPFVMVAPIGRKPTVTGVVLVRGQMPLEEAVGYKPGGAYVGGRHKVYGKALVDGGSARVGASVEKDGGEPVFGNGVATVDHVGAFVELKPQKIASKWVIGDYRMAFGHGLALSTGMSMGRGAAPASIRLRNKPLQGYASSDEVRFLRGTSAEIPFGKRLTVYPFVSYKQVDGVYADDSTGLNSISVTGLHRTKSEMERRHNIDEWMAGGVGKVSFNRLAVEAGVYRYAVELPLLPGAQLYQRYGFDGKSAGLGFLSYTAMLRKAVLSGECASTDDGRMAFSQMFSWEPDGKFAISLRYQRFALGYWAPYMSPGARNADPSGESNVYAGFLLRHNRRIESQAYAFFYKNRWLRYSVDAPSEGYEGMWRTHFSPNESFAHYAQVKWRQGQKNIANNATPAFGTEVFEQYSIRWQGQLRPHPQWKLATRAEYVGYQTESCSLSNGVMLYQDVGFRSVSGKYAVDLRYGLFNTDDYNSRVYVFEPDVRYAFSVPSYSGQGTRVVLVARWSPARNWDVYAKWAHTKYADREEVGSGYDAIASNSRNEIKLQVVYGFWMRREKDVDE